MKNDLDYEVILIDATETPIERPKKNKNTSTLGKKKKHPLKSQIVVDKQSQKVICTAFSKGKRHDFRRYKESRTPIHPSINVIVDTGYQGMQKLHHNTLTPKKKTKKNPLTKQHEINNQKIASERVLNENVIAKIKRFKIISDRYRNRRGLRMHLFASIYN